MAATRLSVNLNKIAVLRNSRGGNRPDILRAGKVCLDAGAHGITVHPRPDARHIRSDDVYALAELCKQYAAEFNIEGNPFAAARDHYPGLFTLCKHAQPDQVTLVPDADGQLTSDHGFDFSTDHDKLRMVTSQYHQLNTRISVFVDAGTDLQRAVGLSLDRLELYTGPYAELFADNNVASQQTSSALEHWLAQYRSTAEQAAQIGLGINAGHDLNQQNLEFFLQQIPHVLEVSIGHALIDEALYAGLESTIKAYLNIIVNA